MKQDFLTELSEQILHTINDIFWNKFSTSHEMYSKKIFL